jgi:hypothetical protein
VTHIPKLEAMPEQSPLKLLKAASTCKSQPLKQYLAAGGSADATVELKAPGHITLTAPLLRVAVQSHLGGRAGIELLLNAGAGLNAFHSHGPEGDRNALMWASEAECCDKATQILLQRGSACKHELA